MGLLSTKCWGFLSLSRTVSPEEPRSTKLLPASFEGPTRVAYVDPHSTRSNNTPNTKVHGPTWGPSGTDRIQMGPMLAPGTLLSTLLWLQFCWENLWHLPGDNFRVNAQGGIDMDQKLLMWRDNPISQGEWVNRTLWWVMSASAQEPIHNSTLGRHHQYQISLVYNMDYSVSNQSTSKKRTS